MNLPRTRYLVSGWPAAAASTVPGAGGSAPAAPTRACGPAGAAGPALPGQSLRDFQALRDAAGHAPHDPRRRRRVVAMADAELADLRRQFGAALRVEPDLPLKLFPMPGLPPMVDAQAVSRELRFRVCGDAGRPVGDCTVYALAGGVGYSGVTDPEGGLTLAVGPAPLARLIVSPRADWWSRVLPEPEAQGLFDTAGGPLRVGLKPLRPGLDLGWVHRLLGVPQAWAQTGQAGAGVRVAIVDSGIDPAQGALRPAGGFNTLDDGDPSVWWVDEKGHGTHCAGVIGGHADLTRGTAAGLARGGLFSGLAPQAELYAVKVFPGGYTSDLVEAIDWCVDQHMDVVNLSLGSPEDSPALNAALQRAYAAGVTVIAAAGNEATHVAYPASTKPAVLSVGALGRIGSFPADSAHSLKTGRYRDSSGQLFSAAFSNFGDEIDVIAPGVAITSTVPTGFAAWDGTSMACPLVSGVAAVVLAASPWLRSGDWRQVAALLHCLRSSVTPLGLPASVQGLGVPHAGRACEVARRLWC